MNGYYNELHMSYMGFGWLIILSFIIVIVLFVFKDRNSFSKKTPQDILDERYAKGEIDHEEYEKRSENLKKINEK